jgi:hypothetical protein
MKELRPDHQVDVSSSHIGLDGVEFHNMASFQEYVWALMVDACLRQDDEVRDHLVAALQRSDYSTERVDTTAHACLEVTVGGLKILRIPMERASTHGYL